MPDPSSSFRRESLIVAALTLVGAVLRFWGPGRLGLNHFDEGIYALAGLWVQSPKGLAGMSPAVVAYAPPLFPMLVGVAYLMLDVSDVSAILVSQVCGVLTIPAVAWVARRTFGPGAGAAAAALAAISGPHIAFSRMALTDSTFLLCWIVALGFGGRFLERPGFLRALPFGLMVGLAQNAKYNGYLAGGIVALTALWGLIVPSSEGRRGALKAMGYGLVAAGIAGLVYWPWFRFVQGQPGGYAGLVAHHRSYLSGPSAWLGHWRLQMGQSTALSGSFGDGLTWGAAAWPVAWLAGTFASRRPEPTERTSRRRGMRFRLGLVLGAAVLGVAPNVGWWVALASLPWLLADRRAGVRLLAVGWLVMAALTPFYHPYARLWLPLHAAGWIVLAGLVPDPGTAAKRVASVGIGSLRTGWPGSRLRDPGAAALGRGLEDETPATRPLEENSVHPLGIGGDSRWNHVARTLRPVALATGVIAAIVQANTFEPRPVPVGSPIEPTDALRTTCERVIAAFAFPGGNPPSRLFLVARPAVAFYLMARMPTPVVRQPDLAAVARSGRAGDFFLMDSTLVPESSPNAFPFPPDRFDVRGMSRSSTGYAMPTTAATLLDVNPGAAFDPHFKTWESLDSFPILMR